MKTTLAALLCITLATLFAAQPTPPPKMFAVRLDTGPAWDAAKKPTEQAGMKEHGANIARMRREGALVLGARCGDTGLMVLRVPDEPAARAQFADDPTIAAGVFKMQVDVFAPFAHGSTAWLTTPEAVVLRAYLDACNRHEPDAVAALLAPGVKWLSLEADKLTVDGDGREALRTWLAGYFGKLPDVRSEFLSIEQTGAFLSVRERAAWTGKDGTRRSQQSHGVYEIRDGLIARAWYFPSVRDPAPPTR
ncbi:MAG: nuclear transport factor 2 family protein [Opitutae bacterium]|nr:nuclear transport factor 2 family protein [Opitutae bacterium]